MLLRCRWAPGQRGYILACVCHARGTAERHHGRDGKSVLPQERQEKRGLKRLDANRQPPDARTRLPRADLESHGVAQRRGAGPPEAGCLPYGQANSAGIVDEWLPVKGWSTDAVKEWHSNAPVPYCWTYGSVPGAGDWAGTSRRSCNLCHS